MRHARLLFALLTALAVSACMQRQPTYYVVDPQTGQPVPVVTQTQFSQPQYAQAGYGQPVYQQPTYQQPAYQPAPVAPGSRNLYSTSPATAQQAYAQPIYPQPAPPAQQPARGGARGLFTSGPWTAQANGPVYQQPSYAQPAQGGPYVAAPNSYASVPPANAPYTLDSGDRLRIVVFGQDGITNGYTVDAGGNVNLPLVGSVPARGFSPTQLAAAISERLKQGYVREPHVSVEVETYRPFFILGEVTTPGQYPYVANMTAETAVAIAGGFSPRADKRKIELTRNAPGQTFKGDVPLSYPIRPGDTIQVKERWF